MIFEVYRKLRKPDGSLDDQCRVVNATDIRAVINWIANSNLAGVEMVRVELSKITNIDNI